MTGRRLVGRMENRTVAMRRAGNARVDNMVAVGVNGARCGFDSDSWCY